MNKMNKIIYSNISASRIHYLVIDFILNLKEFYEKGDTLILCFWDYDVYNFDNKDANVSDNRIKIREITGELSRLLNGLEIEHKIIYLSDALHRINNHEDLFNLLVNCYNSITMGKIEDIYKNNKYLKLRPSTLGKINFMVVDYLVALFFKELYPTLSKGKSVDIYHTGERFLGIKDSVEEMISKKELVVNFPAIKYWRALPILNYSSGNWISAAMSRNEIEKIIRENYPKDKDTLKDLIKIGLRVEDSVLDHKINSFLSEIDKIKDHEVIVQEIANIFLSYFEYIKSLIEQSEESEIKKITYVDSKEKLQKVLETLNPSKLEILKQCNGKNTVEDIIKHVSVKESSVRSYISRMRNEKLITNSKKPIRLVDEILISFD
jgi:hypothetical protein